MTERARYLTIALLSRLSPKEVTTFARMKKVSWMLHKDANAIRGILGPSRAGEGPVAGALLGKAKKVSDENS